jgi:hypothetical protein
VLTNTILRLLPHLRWPSRTPALALISDLSLNVFLAMSLMSMQLWTDGGLGPALAAVLAVQTVAAVAYMLFLVFPAMGRNYLAAVIAAGFSGISHRHYDGGNKSIWRGADRLHNPAPCICLLYRHCQRPGHRLLREVKGDGHSDSEHFKDHEARELSCNVVRVAGIKPQRQQTDQAGFCK